MDGEQMGRAIAWVERSLRRELNAGERELVAVVCAAFGVGPWNVHRDWSIMRSGFERHASITVADDLSTFDGPKLTRLVFAAHDRCVRLSVGPAGPGRSKIEVWTGRGREGGYAERHPTLDQAVAAWKREQALCT